MNSSKNLAAMILIGLVVVTSGCLNGGEDPAPSSEEVDRTVNVTGGDIWFEIEGEREDLELEFEEGETVRFNFENVAGFHNLVIPELDAGTESFSAEETRSFVVTFEETGEFEFICSVGNHADEGQRGLITVT